MLPFSGTILLWRLERRLSQEELAKRAQISRPNLSAIERGKREVSLKTLRALAMALRVRPGLLVDGVGPPAVENKPHLSREALERVADAVVYGKAALNPEEKMWASLLRAVTRNRMAAARGELKVRPFGKRTVDAAWLQLASRCPPEIVQSLFQRIADREVLQGKR